jgi:hypothetical protein
VCVTGAILEAQPVPNIEPCSSDLDISADCADSADDQPTDVFDDQSIALESIQSGHTELIVGPNHKGSDAYQWDEDSDGDSLMPRRRQQRHHLENLARCLTGKVLMTSLHVVWTPPMRRLR